MVNHHTNMVSNVILADVSDLAHMLVCALLVGSRLLLVIPPIVSLLGFSLGLVFLNDRLQIGLDLMEEFARLERKLDELTFLT